MKKVYIILGLSLISILGQAADLSWTDLENRFNEKKINLKALGHVKCFFDKYEKTSFFKKIPEGKGSPEVIKRCLNGSMISVSNPNIFAIVDYTTPSDNRRMHLIDRKNGTITSIAVAHGRYEAGLFNKELSSNSNSIKMAEYYSNEIDSNAPSSGFYIAGLDYKGKFGQSLVLHGIEKGINDNICERAVVIHKHPLVSRSKVSMLSSGCLMINSDYLEFVIDLLKGKKITEKEETGGALVFVYGKREKEWATSTCLGNFSN